MRLTQLKFSGFKSFVDPTTLNVSSHLVGIVGPNGCGKSNVIDAVRWVLGESRAAELRGESMQDVIFNGSVGRKPAGRASVELIFDNAEGRAGGSWSRYAEISVRRVLSRDGQSSYSINGQSVRRRDVTDLFLGTGLGPKAYAIIGQGMINRVVESRPEELRVFLEEAAGVSKYRERRRETESRLSTARENLDRLHDIRQEIHQRIEALTVQAGVAQSYRELSAQRITAQTRQLALKLHEAEDTIQRRTVERDGAQTAIYQLEQELVLSRDKLEVARKELDIAQSNAQTAQAQVYDINSRVLEQQTEERASQAALEAAQRRASAESAAIEEAESRVEDLQFQVEQGEQQLAAARQALAELDAERLQREEGLKPLAQAAELARQEQLEAASTLAAAQADLRNLRQQIDTARRNSEAALQRLAERQNALAALPAPELVLGQAEAARQQRDSLAAAYADAEVQLQALRERRQALEAEVQASQSQLAQLQSAAAKADAAWRAQSALLKQMGSPEGLGAWLEKASRAGSGALGSPLFESVQVPVAHRRALESYLGERLQARGVESLEALLRYSSNEAPPSTLTVLEGTSASSGHGATNATSTANNASLGPAWIEVLRAAGASLPPVVEAMLHGVYFQESTEAALALRGFLQPGQVLVTPEGHVLAAGFASPSRRTDPNSLGLLEQTDKVKALAADQLQAQEALAAAQASHAELTAQLQEVRPAAQQAEHDKNRLQQEAHQAEMAHVRLSEAVSRQQLQRESIEQAIAQLQQQADAHRQSLEAVASQEAGLGEALSGLTSTLAAKEAAQANAQSLLAAEQQRLGLCRDRVDAARERLASLQGQAARLADSIVFSQTARAEAEQRQAEAEAEAQAARQKLAGSRLQQLLQQKTEAEQRYTEANNLLESASAGLRQEDQKRQSIDTQLLPLRQKISEAEQAIAVASATQEQTAEQAGSLSLDPEALRASWPNRLPPQDLPKLSSLSQEIARLNREIETLGSVNLVALEELTEAQKRAEFLDAQAGDLQEAVDTLEDAIRKIDQESRALLQSTYDTVNANFGRLFPALFGGGEARLVLTGEEILDSGVQVMAQPPGKRNSSIHQLSGGEKTMTATALVFALFQLNPAPFCLLDEVDAPLDEPNTERLGQMIREMSSATQFIFITHNKITMELAEHLVGVTMQERGVSRLVAVDLQAASAMVDDTVMAA